MSMRANTAALQFRVNDESADLAHAIRLAGTHRADQPLGLGRLQNHRSCEFFAQMLPASA